MTFLYIRRIYFTLFIPAIIGLSSCEKFEGDQEIPAYLSIDSIFITTDYQKQGSASQRITDAWVYVGDDYIGTFELPARFPVLKSGKLPVKIWPGIKKNGIATTRVAYDFYSPVEKTLILTPDSSTKAGVLKTTYQSTTKFNWLEDFEDVAITLDTTSRSSAYIERTPSGSPLTFEGTHSAFIQLDSARDFFEAQTRDEYTIPSAPVFLELNFNISNSVTIGVFTYGNTVLYQSPIITLNPTNGTWKKIYIDLTTTLNAYSGMTSFRVYLGTFRDSGLDQPTLMFDNFKIVTR